MPILAAVPTPPLGPIWVVLLIVGAVAGVVVGQQCGRRPLPLLPALGKLTLASVVAAAAMALLGYAAGGELGNFGHVGVDQTTFAPAVFLWFMGIGGLTVAMAGGITRQPRAPKPTFGRESASESRRNVDLDEPPEYEESADERPGDRLPEDALPDDELADEELGDAVIPDADFKPAFEPVPDAEPVFEPAFEPLPPSEPTFGRESTSRARHNVDFDDLPDPEDLEYIDDEDAAPGPIGDTSRKADD